MKRPVIFFMTFFFLFALTVETQADTLKKKKKGKTEIKDEKPKPTPYEKLLKKGVTTTVKSDFITLHKVESKVYAEFPLKYLNREMLLASTPSEVSSLSFADIGFKETGTLHVKFTRRDSTINLCCVNSYATTNDTNIQRALSRTAIDPILFSYPVKAFNKDSSAVVIDMTTLFCGDIKIFKLFPEGGGAIRVNASLNKDAVALLSMKSFEDNLSVKTLFSYDVSVVYMGNVFNMDEPYTVTQTRSLLLLPETKMMPRVSDSRVGVFNDRKRAFLTTEDKVKNYSLANRWRVEPKDPDAYRRGELVEPVKPIVFYVDNAFPETWKGAVKEGIERWNRAFEKIGFKNVMIAKDFPTAIEDSAFDPDNLKYSCIRYLPSPTANAMGPSWVDPTTGEIINASVIVYGNIVQLINNWRFVQTAQIDPRVRAKKMPDDILRESLGYVIAHEVGHCLGFMHNMGASSAYPVDSLRSVSFTRKHGTTPCIMDYARFNYVAQPEDIGVKLTPPDLGEYDDFLVKWNYTYLTDTKTAWDEQPITESWVDAHAGDPVYRYGRQQVAARYDPTAIEEDLGNDPIKAGEYGIKNLKYILDHLEDWINDDNDYTHRRALYSQIQNQYYRYLRNVLYNVGGIRLAEVKAGTPGEKHVPVAKEIQQKSLQWVLNEYRNMDWLDRASLKKYFPLEIHGADAIRVPIANALKGLANNVILSSYYAESPYTIEDYTNDLYLATWNNLLQNKPLAKGDMALQNAVVDLFCSSLDLSRTGQNSLSLAYIPTADDLRAYRENMPEPGNICSRHADKLRVEDLLPLLNNDGCGHALWEDNHFGEPGYGWQFGVNVSAIDQSKSYLQNMAIKSRDLLRSRVNNASGNDKVHYQTLLIKLNTALKDKL
ncbi:MAG: zinc-dependent metalloprotease [Bacteroidales bacterium]|jgi:hypothetical protein|nr:zinc-dependent metalloprotease [Bacteroidales bacterium]